MDTPGHGTPDSPQPDDINALMLRRREELASLIAMGVDPYPRSYDVTASSSGIVRGFVDGGEQLRVRIAGRIMSIRRMGKLPSGTCRTRRFSDWSTLARSARRSGS